MYVDTVINFAKLPRTTYIHRPTYRISDHLVSYWTFSSGNTNNQAVAPWPSKPIKIKVKKKNQDKKTKTKTKTPTHTPILPHTCHWRLKRGSVPPLTAKNLPKIGKKREKIRKIRGKEGKIGKKRKNWKGVCTLPLLTDKAGYATLPTHPHTHPFFNTHISTIFVNEVVHTPFISK